MLLKRLKITAAVIGVLLVSAVPHASADTGLSNVNLLPQCGDTSLVTWDWGAAIKAISGGAFSDFDYDTSSYVVFHNDNSFGGNTNNNRYQVLVADAGKKLSLDEISGVPKVRVSNNYIRQAGVISEDQNIPAYNGNWTGGFSANQKSASAGSTNTSTTGATIGIYSGTSGTNIYDCEYGAKNVTYGPSWTSAQFNGTILHGSGTGSTCGSLDVACYVGKALQGVQNTIVSGVSAVLNVLGAWFIPDSATLSDDFDNVTSNLSAHLGFLTYPPTFLVDFYGAFDSSSSWCNDTSCTKYLGTIFGAPFTLNLGAMKDVTPTLWSFMTAAVRGLTVLAIIFALRHKFLEVTRR